jgi:hypothetical protein
MSFATVICAAKQFPGAQRQRCRTCRGPAWCSIPTLQVLGSDRADFYCRTCADEGRIPNLHRVQLSVMSPRAMRELAKALGSPVTPIEAHAYAAAVIQTSARKHLERN